MNDWPQMIRDLRAAGLTDWKIAAAIGYKNPKGEHTEALERGAIPRHDIGEALIALHNILCLKSTSAQPIARSSA